MSGLKELSENSFIHIRNGVSPDLRVVLQKTQAILDDQDSAIMKRQGIGTIDPVMAGEIISCATASTTQFHEFVESIAVPVLKNLIGDAPYYRTPYGGIFLSHPQRRGQDFYWHSDGHFDGIQEAGVNFWIPLRDCGTDAAGLKMLTANERELVENLPLLPQRHSPDHFTSVDWPLVTDDILTNAFGPRRITAPTIDVGDIIVFTASHIHKTYHTPNMPYTRGAAIVRYKLSGRPWLVEPNT